MVTFCTSEYGAYTGVGYETFHELEFAHDHRLPLFPIRLCEQWPPAPQNNERGIYQNQLVFKNGLVYIDDRQMTQAQWVADQIAESVARMGIFSELSFQIAWYIDYAGAIMGKSEQIAGECSWSLFGSMSFSRQGCTKMQKAEHRIQTLSQGCKFYTVRNKYS